MEGGAPDDGVEKPVASPVRAMELLEEGEGVVGGGFVPLPICNSLKLP